MLAPAPPSPGAHAAFDVVLDTNVWLDLLVFADHGVRTIAGALEDGRLRARIDEFGTSELARVLSYRLGRHQLDCAAQATIIASCTAMACGFTRDPAAAPSAQALPQCRDPHDQPFLELTRDCGARWLITKDRDLLMLARNHARLRGFAILTPQAATALLRKSAESGD